MIRLKQVQAEGFGVFHDRMTVDLDRRGRVLILGVNDDTASAESNGAGKTTILKAITWGLFGVTVDGLSTSDIVHKAAKAAEVKVTFAIDGGSEYTVTRRRTAKTGKLRLEELVGGKLEDRSQTKAKATQLSIETALGMDFETFRCTVLFGQGDHSRFASRSLGDAARKAILGRILGLGRYDAARVEAKAARSRIDEELARLNRLHSGTSRKLTELNLDLARVSGELKGMPTTSDLEAERDDLARQMDDDERAAREAASEASEARGFIDEIDLELNDVEALYDEWRGKAATAKAELNASRDHYDVISDPGGGTCRSCGQDLPAGDPDPAAVKQAKARVDEAITESARVEKGVARVKRKIVELRAERMDESSKWSEASATASARSRSAKARAAKHEEIAKRLVEHLKIACDLEAQRDSLAEEAEELAANIEAIEGEIGAANHRRAIVDWWVNGFGPKGVPAYAIEQALPVINTRANRHLVTLADGDISVVWSATTTGSSGATKEQLTQAVTIEGVEDSVPSGGQQKKIELATELALSEMKRETEGLGMDILFIDEALDGLDGEGQRRVVEWLETLGAGSIFVISHDPGIASEFDSTVVVQKTGGRSVVKGGLR